MNTSSLVQKVWNFCHTLRDDGVGYGDYLEQLTYLLFLKLPASSAFVKSARQAERAGMTPEILKELLRDES